MEVLLNQLMKQEPLITESKRPHVRKLLYKLIEKQDSPDTQQYYLFKILRAHILPLTNCAFNKSGDRFITGSYDRTCKVWNTVTGEELLTLEGKQMSSIFIECCVFLTWTNSVWAGHKNVVYAIAFNNPFGDKIITGSFDKTCKVWNSQTGELYHTLRGHATEIVCLSFNPQGNVIATGSMDNTAKLWDTETGTEIASLLGHTAEIVSLSFNQQGDKLITGSFDHTTKLWDVKSGRCIHTFQGVFCEIFHACQPPHVRMPMYTALMSAWLPLAGTHFGLKDIHTGTYTHKNTHRHVSHVRIFGSCYSNKYSASPSCTRFDARLVYICLVCTHSYTSLCTMTQHHVLIFFLNESMSFEAYKAEFLCVRLYISSTYMTHTLHLYKYIRKCMCILHAAYTHQIGTYVCMYVNMYVYYDQGTAGRFRHANLTGRA